MVNEELVWAFERIADLLEITGADGFRISSYRRAARTINDTTEDIAVLAAENRLGKLPGIGKSTAAKIEQFIREGKIDLLEELSANLPAGLPDLLGVPGLGPKKVAVLHSELGVGSLDELKAALEAGMVEALPGFGKTSAARIAEGIAMLDSFRGRTPLGVALPVGRGLAEDLTELNQVRRVEVAGSLRRGAETVGDIDLVCDSAAGEKVVEAFTSLENVKRVLGKGPTKGSITVELPGGWEVGAQLRVVPTKSFGAALQYFTGSKEHNVRLRELAVKKGLKLNEWGLFKGDKRVAGTNEEDIYAKLGLVCPPPELREDRDEFAADFDPSKLVRLEDLRGELHVHTTASDGRNTIEEMGRAAKECGFEYLAITDHTKGSAIANGLSVERMWQHVEDIRKADRKLRGVKILVGCECDILSDGSLDYPYELLAECDWVVASIHSAMSGGKVPPTERTIRAMGNKYVGCVGHPTGRLLGARNPMKLDMAAVVAAAAETQTALEVNASWLRLDLKDVHVRQALEAGAMLAIATDAHSTDDLAWMEFGVTTARRGACPADRVVNTWPWTRLRKWIGAKRSKGRR